MNHPWVDASQLRRASGSSGDPWAVDYGVHTFLDPRFVDQPTRQGKLFWQLYKRSRIDDRTYRDNIAKLLHPLGSEPRRDDLERMVGYLNEVNAYLDELVDLLPDEASEHARQLPRITACNDMRTLLSILFSRENRRCRYEAQRKLYLAQLLIDIEHSRDIQDGPRHKSYFEMLVTDSIWRHRLESHDLQVGFEIGPDGQTIRYNIGPRPGQQSWRFNSIFIEPTVQGRKIPLDVLYYSCRFKRSVTPVSFELVDGRHQVLEKRRWGSMRSSRNGSILSKMIRRSIADPDDISDLLGAMFIVPDEDGLNDLLTILNNQFGSLLRWRNVTDTMGPAADGSRLNPQSGEGYKVFKGDLDVLHPNPEPDRPPYSFKVEVQIYTLEGFLRTVHGAHSASHMALKLRQFLYGLVPRLFPRDIFGADWIRLD